MADRDYGHGRGGGWRERDSSIFSDDDDRGRRSGSGRWSGGYGRDDDRGFFERAGDEVRSWFGDEEAERRREMDLRRDEARDAFGGDRSGEDRDRSRGQFGPGGYGAYESGRGAFGWGGEQSGYERGRGGFGGRRSQWDDNYRHWRERQLEQFDCEYEDYCRERQQQFDRDFDSWRSSRLTEGGYGAGSSGSSQESARATTRSLGAEGAGAISAGAGGGIGSATTSSTGSTGAAAETGGTRTGRSRSRDQ